MMSKLSCVLSLAAEVAALLLMGGEPHPAVLKLALVACMGLALALGFNAVNPPRWLRDRAVLGTACVHAGIACIFINPSFLISAALIGAGIRLLTKEFAPKANATVRHVGHDLAVRESGVVATRD